jgi:hypothetical protein
MTFRMLTSGTGWYRPDVIAPPVIFNVSRPANIDYAAGAYGEYALAALGNPNIQGVTVNMDWDSVQSGPGYANCNFATTAPNLATVLSDWSSVGKHCVLILRYTLEENAGFGPVDGLPSWVASDMGVLPAENAPHGSINNSFLADYDSAGIVPNVFNSTFQTYWQDFIGYLGQYLTSLTVAGGGTLLTQTWVDCISYIRVAMGLGGEGFAIMPSGPNGNANYATYVNDIQSNSAWLYSSEAWRTWQEGMLTYCRSAGFPTRSDGSIIPFIYPMVTVMGTAANSVCLDTGHQCAQDVAEWAMSQGGYQYGIGNENMPGTVNPYGASGAGYAGILNAFSYAQENYPDTYIQVQSAGTLTDAGIAQSVANMEAFGGSSIEWYERIVTALDDAGNESLAGFQEWVTSTYG